MAFDEAVRGVVEDEVRGEVDNLLADVGLGVIRDLLPYGCELAGAELRANSDAEPAGASARLHDEGVQVVEDVLTGMLVEEAVAFGLREYGFLAEVVPYHLRDPEEDEFVVGCSRAQRVNQGDVTLAVGLPDAGYKGLDVFDAPVHDVDDKVAV